jgi:fused signal recognition particle receptor
MFGLIRRGLEKTARILTSDIRDLLKLRRKIDGEFLEDLEERLMSADLGPRYTQKVIEALEKDYRDKKVENPEELISYLRQGMKATLTRRPNDLLLSSEPPTVILVAGVNGVGKTTSIGKLAYHFREQGRSVLLAASDTYRAAAVEQLALWSERVGADIVRGAAGGDPAAVAFDAVEAVCARKKDILLVDTAGRLHTKDHLMRELGKIRKVIQKKLPGAPHEVLLVLDATTGQNAVEQARTFKDLIEVTGLFLAKLDGTAKGGVVLAIADQIEIPVKFVGVGERQEDVLVFNPDEFIDGLFAEKI